MYQSSPHCRSSRPSDLGALLLSHDAKICVTLEFAVMFTTLPNGIFRLSRSEECYYYHFTTNEWDRSVTRVGRCAGAEDGYIIK